MQRALPARAAAAAAGHCGRRQLESGAHSLRLAAESRPRGGSSGPHAATHRAAADDARLGSAMIFTDCRFRDTNAFQLILSVGAKVAAARRVCGAREPGRLAAAGRAAREPSEARGKCGAYCMSMRAYDLTGPHASKSAAETAGTARLTGRAVAAPPARLSASAAAPARLPSTPAAPFALKQHQEPGGHTRGEDAARRRAHETAPRGRHGTRRGSGPALAAGLPLRPLSSSL